MSVQACAEIVAAGDADRFAAAMTAPVEDRDALFPLYAFNLEISKAPWLTSEPMIAQMRLQFWRDVLDEVQEGKKARAHEVVEPLAAAIRARGIPLAPLHQMIDARQVDIEREPFEGPAALWHYLETTAGALMVASMGALGHRVPDQARVLGRAQGLAAFIAAQDDLEAHGWRAVQSDMLPGMVETALGDLSALPKRFGMATPAARVAWRTRARLEALKAGKPAVESEFARRTSLVVKTVLRRW